MNIVTIDPSLVCTGLTVNGEAMAFVAEHVALSKTKIKRWFELADEYSTIHFISKLPTHECFSTSEVAKLNFLESLAEKIVCVVDSTLKKRDNTLFVIEGYSYSSAAGPLIDLVTFGTILRCKIYERIPDWELIILAPTTVKKLAAKLTYPPIKKGKKTEYRNTQGVAGGSFGKHDIYRSLIENKSITTDWVEFLRKHEEEIFNLKNMPKPLEDINDSMVTYHAVLQANDGHDDIDVIRRNLREV